MKSMGIVGWSGSGKTTLIRKLIPCLLEQGVRTSTMKHTHHRFDMDQPGKDSYVHREAGAKEVMVVSSSRWALLHEFREEPEPPIEQLIGCMTAVDLLLIEGFKTHSHPKVAVYREGRGREKPDIADTTIIAIASDVRLEDSPVPVIDINDTDAIAAFIMEACGLRQAIEKDTRT